MYGLAITLILVISRQYAGTVPLGQPVVEVTAGYGDSARQKSLNHSCTVFLLLSL